MGVQHNNSPLDAASPGEGNVRKRVCKACDRCRLKKSKCDGSSPCGRCRADNAICVFGERKKSHDKVYPKGYVEMLENQQAQLVAGLQELYRRTLNGQGWLGSPLKETSQGAPLTHDILERLGALKRDGSTTSEPFEEDLHQLQRRLVQNGAALMSRDTSSLSDSGSEAGQSPMSDQVSFTNPFGMNQFPPTPPNHSPYQRTLRATAPAKEQLSLHTPSMRSALNPGMVQRHSWAQPLGFNDDMDFINRFQSPISLTEPSLLALNAGQRASYDASTSWVPWVEDEMDYEKLCVNPKLI